MRINKGIIYRFESKIDQGTLYIFDLNKEKIYTAGYSEYTILEAIFHNEFSKLMSMQDKKSQDKIKKFINVLSEKGVVIQ